MKVAMVAMNHRIPRASSPAPLVLLALPLWCLPRPRRRDELVPEDLPTTPFRQLSCRAQRRRRSRFRRGDRLFRRRTRRRSGQSQPDRALLILAHGQWRYRAGERARQAAGRDRQGATRSAGWCSRSSALKRAPSTEAATQLAKDGQRAARQAHRGAAHRLGEQGHGHVDQALKTIGDLTGPSWYGIFKDYHQALICRPRRPQGRRGPGDRRAYKTDASALRVVDAYGRIARPGRRAARGDQGAQRLRGAAEPSDDQGAARRRSRPASRRRRWSPDPAGRRGGGALRPRLGDRHRRRHGAAGGLSAACRLPRSRPRTCRSWRLATSFQRGHAATRRS